MTEQLSKNLYTKHRLSFNNEGKFKILLFSDVQERTNFDKKTLDCINMMLDEAKPDLVVLGGDQCMGPDVHSVEDFKKFLSVLASPMEQRKIPWAHIYGNHDYDLEFEQLLQQSFYEEYPFCISKHTEGISGVTNFMLPIFKHNSDEVGFSVWGLDTHRDKYQFAKDYGIEKMVDFKNNSTNSSVYDFIKFDQMMWYWNSSVELERHSGKKIPGLMCMHVAPVEFSLAIDNPEQCALKGYNPEKLDSGVLNSGIFAEVLQRGDIRCICCGHTHMNSFEADLFGIKACFDGSAGLTCYGEAETRGGRIFEIDEQSPDDVLTYPVFYKDFVTL
ncbi:MAG: metallophosphoesterase [Clostridia bacterium]|nr:metallophosphoesterase [Clostridia bacterium]